MSILPNSTAVENPEYEKIGEVKVNKVELKTYKDLIYEIKVVANKDSTADESPGITLRKG